MDMKLGLMIGFFMAAVAASCSGQNAAPNDPANPVVVGDTVSQLGNNIMVIFHDSKNVYWFGSWETGVYRYDGNTIINYTTKHGLKHNRIDEIKEDKYGNLYFNGCYPFSAITKFDGQRFVPLAAVTSNDWKLLPDDLWFKHTTNAGRIYRFDGVFLHDLPFPNHPEFENPFEIYSTYKDKEGNMWFGSNPVGVCRYNGNTFDWITERDVTELHGGPANGVRSIIEDKDGFFWFNSAYRYKIFDSSPASASMLYERQKSIGSLDGNENGNLDEYLSIAKDTDDNLWIATYRNGVWQYDGRRVRHFSVQENGEDINLFFIFKDNHGDLWLGTHQNGAWKFNGETFEKFLM